ncbi:MAG: hypothetical protein ACRBEQ_04860 [Hyphomonas sp.]
MTNTLNYSLRARAFAFLREGGAFMVQILIGFLVVLAAGAFAVMTAFAGLMLAVAALVMRFAGQRQMKPVPVKKSAVTLDARPTPRGWTVE